VETETKRRGLKAVGFGLGASCVGLLATQGGGVTVGAREALTGQCGVDSYSASWAISSDAQLTMTLAPNGQSRRARFRFFGGDAIYNQYYWDHYQYRYGVTATNFGPQSNEVVRFGGSRDNSGDGPYTQYNSPDSHNSNVDGAAPVQWHSYYYSPAGDTEIWIQAIFDVPNTPDPACWTNAVAYK